LTSEGRAHLLVIFHTKFLNPLPDSFPESLLHNLVLVRISLLVQQDTKFHIMVVFSVVWLKRATIVRGTRSAGSKGIVDHPSLFRI
jgi:hypothetical protein